jgi:DNA-binding transcriptional ArsR family regulator
MSLLPSSSEASPPDDAGPRVIGVESDDADDVLSALSSETARKLLAAVHEDPGPPSDLADRVDTSIQNAQYHLQNLEEAGAIEVVDTAYSAKGREMDVYAPSDQPLVIFAGDEGKSSTLKTALKRLLGAVGILAAGSLAVQAALGRGSFLSGLLGFESAAPPDGGSGGVPAGGDGGDGAGAGGAATDTPTEAVTDSPADVPTEPPPTETPEDSVGIFEQSTETPGPSPEATGTPDPTPKGTEQFTETPLQTVTETAHNVTTEAQNLTAETIDTGADVTRATAETLPPGLVFFAGGLFVLVAVAAVWYLRE